MSAWGYAFEEAWASLRRAGRSAAVSVGTIGIAFLALGGFLLVSINVQRVLDNWLQAAELSVYLGEPIGDEEVATLRAFLAARPVVADVEYVSKAAARERFVADFPELADVTSGLPENPFPASFEVRLRGGREAEQLADELSREVAGQPGVADVRYDRRWVSRLLAIVAGARMAGAVAAGVLMLGAAFTVAAVVRLSMHARRDELDIMQLVGAPFSFIRGPAVAEGLLLGGLGAALALLAVWVLHAVVRAWLGPDLAGLLGPDTFRFLGLRDAAAIAAGGLGVGALSGAVVARSVR